MTNKKKFLGKIAAMAVAGLIIGCAGSPKPEPVQTTTGKWQSRPIKADGSQKDWPRSTPQYKNAETDTKIWVSNNSEQICLLAQVKDPGIVRRLTQGGLALSVKTGEKNAKPFSIKFKGHAPLRPRGGAQNGPDQQDTKDRKTLDPSAMDQARPPGPGPDVKLPDSLVVTYPFSSGPVTMSMKEARLTGIALGLADAGRHTLIFEAVISLDAIFFDVPQTAGTVVSIALSAQEQSSAMKRRAKKKGNKGDRPQGAPPGEGPPGQGPSGNSHGPGKPDDMKQTKSSDGAFKTEIEVILAGPSK